MVGPVAPREGRSSSPSALNTRLKRWSLGTVLAMLINEAGVTNVLASTMLTIAVPAVATAFVYEVGSMRRAALEHEAVDRAQYATRLEAEVNLRSQDADGRPAAASKVDWVGKLDAMLASRATILDLFGDEPSTVAPVYGRIIRQMLRDDEETFTALPRAGSGEADGRAELGARQARLREVHDRLARLAGA